MGVKLFQVDSVILGRFNPFIITPEWVKKEGIDDADKVEVLFAVAGREVAFQFKTKQFRWQVDYGRLVVEAHDLSADSGAKAAAVIEKLPHTPVSAVGNNFHYRALSRDWSAGLPMLGRDVDFKKLGSHGKVTQVTWSCRIQKDSGLTVGITIEQTEEEVVANMNFHRTVADKDQTVAAGKKFMEDREESKKLLADICGEKVD